MSPVLLYLTTCYHKENGGKKGKSFPEGAQEGWQLWERCLSG